jgi:excisionase family DNA binding protein
VSEEVLSLPEAARYLRVSEDTIRRAIKEGSLKAAKLRGHYRIRKADLDALFKKQPPPKDEHQP